MANLLLERDLYGNIIFIYDDGTYRYHRWPESCPNSSWKIENGLAYFRHDRDGPFGIDKSWHESDNQAVFLDAHKILVEKVEKVLLNEKT